MDVPRERAYLTDVGRPGHPGDQPLEPDRETAMWWEAHLVRLDVLPHRLDRLAPLGQRGDVVLVAVQTLPARDELEPAEEQVETVGVGGPGRVRVGVERALDHRVTRHEDEVAAVLAQAP